MSTRTRVLPSWLLNVGETNSGKEGRSSANQRGKQQATRTVNKTPKKETVARGKAVKTSPVKNLAFSESEDEDSKDTAISPRKRSKEDSKQTGRKPLTLSDSEEELDKELAQEVANKEMVRNGLLQKVSRDIPTTSEEVEDNVDKKLATNKPRAISDGEESAEKTPQAVVNLKDSGSCVSAGGISSAKLPAISDESEWNQLEIKSSPVHEDGSDAENTAETNIGDVNSSMLGGDDQNINTVGGNTSVNQTADDNDTNTPDRPTCKYGSGCYRRNPQHLQDFSHPGDADYSTGDNRLECEYGTACYRKNPLHRQHYKHTKTPPVQNAKQTNRRKLRRRGSDDSSDTDSNNQGSSRNGRKKRKTRSRKPTNGNEDDDDDDYDYDDPFLNDGSSDDYAPTDSGSETDFSVAENGSGDEEDDAKRTQKEAKNFLKKKK